MSLVAKKPKSRICALPECRKTFSPRPGANSFEKWCSPECGLTLARQKQARAAEKKEREQKAKWRREASESRAAYRRGRAKSGPERQAQDAVNAYILVRDADKPCIVHGRQCPHAHSGFHAGHYRPVGAFPELRFNTWNIHKQCAISNMGSQNRARWGGSTDQLYETNLIARIGKARVDKLKGPGPPLQPNQEYLDRIKRIFTRRARHLARLRQYE